PLEVSAAGRLLGRAEPRRYSDPGPGAPETYADAKGRRTGTTPGRTLITPPPAASRATACVPIRCPPSIADRPSEVVLEVLEARRTDPVVVVAPLLVGAPRRAARRPIPRSGQANRHCRRGRCHRTRASRTRNGRGPRSPARLSRQACTRSSALAPTGST